MTSKGTNRRLLPMPSQTTAYSAFTGTRKTSLSPSQHRAKPGLQRQFIETFLQRIATYAASEQDVNHGPDANYEAEPIYMVSALRKIEPMVIERFADLLQSLGMANRKQLPCKARRCENGMTRSRIIATVMARALTNSSRP